MESKNAGRFLSIVLEEFLRALFKDPKGFVNFIGYFREPKPFLRSLPCRGLYQDLRNFINIFVK